MTDEKQKDGVDLFDAMLAQHTKSSDPSEQPTRRYRCEECKARFKLRDDQPRKCPKCEAGYSKVHEIRARGCDRREVKACEGCGHPRRVDIWKWRDAVGRPTTEHWEKFCAACKAAQRAAHYAAEARKWAERARTLYEKQKACRVKNAVQAARGAAAEIAEKAKKGG